MNKLTLFAVISLGLILIPLVHADNSTNVTYLYQPSLLPSVQSAMQACTNANLQTQAIASQAQQECAVASIKAQSLSDGWKLFMVLCFIGGNVFFALIQWAMMKKRFGPYA